jgi:hypothetical protein
MAVNSGGYETSSTHELLLKMAIWPNSHSLADMADIDGGRLSDKKGCVTKRLGWQAYLDNLNQTVLARCEQTGRVYCHQKE